MHSEIAGRPVEADEFDVMCAYEYARETLPSYEALLEALDALEGVIRVADRKTVEFDAARAVAEKLRTMLK